jgi:hypothetical protein
MKKPISQARSGDVICVDRGLYCHYGVYDHGKVIDISPDNGNNSLSNKHNAVIRKRSLKSFLNGDQGYVDNTTGIYSRKKTLRRARAEIGSGKDSYDLIFNNCEHKAREWQTGVKQSGQVEDALEFAANMVVNLARIFR